MYGVYDSEDSERNFSFASWKPGKYDLNQSKLKFRNSESGLIEK
jgi:hypothetical protein